MIASTVVVVTVSAVAVALGQAGGRHGLRARLWAPHLTARAARSNLVGLMPRFPAPVPLDAPATPHAMGPQATRALATRAATALPPPPTRTPAAAAPLLLALGVVAGTLGHLASLALRPRRAFTAPTPPVAMLSTAAAVETPVPKSHATVDHDALGYDLVKTEFLKEFNSEATLYRHRKSGAEVLSMANTDENKVFGITFRTTPTNSTGIPHILEHSVLCGSRKYPVKEPFVELLKGSLNTFLNAMTFPDKTCYPVASTNLKDFYNLVDVYLDAVFYPNIGPETFMQEGYHLEAEAPEDPLKFKGVVFNEMKGVYSQPDAIFGYLCQQNLFIDPKVTYSVNSGGDPREIPSLTFKEYYSFFKYFYHPSNSRIFFYGDDDLEKRLSLLNEYLNDYTQASYAEHQVRYQEQFPEPRRVVDYYAASKDGEQTGKSYLGVNWVLNWDKLDDEEELALSLLNDMIMGSNAAPLRRALNESGLGSAVVGGGVETGLLQATFGVGMKDVKAQDTEQLEALILDTLQRIADEGFTTEQIEASVNSTEFAMRELNTGGFPRGIAIMLGALNHWLHDRDPIEPLKFEKPLAALKARMAAGEDVFAPMIRKYLLDNTHRVTVVLHPDPHLGDKLEAEERSKLDAIKQGMSPEEIETVIEMKRKLLEKQETPDDPEALKCIPTLRVEDLEKTNKVVPTVVSSVKGSTLLSHPIATNNILYLDMAFDLHTLPEDLVPYLPLFTRALTELGTKKEDFVALTQRIKRKVGGVSKSVMTSSVLHRPGAGGAHLIVRGKGTATQLGELAEILADVLLEPEFNNQQKFRQMVLESQARLEGGLVGAGHRVAAGRLAAMDNPASYASEQMGGLTYMAFLRDLKKKVDSDWPSVVATLETMRQHIVNRTTLVLNVTADEGLQQAFAPTLEGLVDRLPAVEPVLRPWQGLLPRANEGITIPTQVNYVAKAANLYEAGYQYHGSANVISKYLGMTWIWDRVRVVGGAYGGFCSFDRLSGMFSYGSYRDPNLLSTLEAYDGTADFLRSLDLSDDALNKAIIGAIGDFDAYQLPDAKGYSALTRYLLNVQDADRQLTRDHILGTTRADFRRFADHLDAVRDKGTVVVVGSEAQLDAAQDLFTSRLSPFKQDTP